MRAASPASLVPHPVSPAPPDVCITASARRTTAGVLTLAFRLEGDLDHLRIPPPRPAAVVDGLWRHTCFEAFVAHADGEAYHEVNLAPSGEWAVYAFRAYRERVPLDAVPPPSVAVSRMAGHLVLEARLRLATLDRTLAQAPLRVGLAAVLEDAADRCSYWSLRHPPGPPDFHHRDGRTLRLEAPHGACEAG